MYTSVYPTYNSRSIDYSASILTVSSGVRSATCTLVPLLFRVVRLATKYHCGMLGGSQLGLLAALLYTVLKLSRSHYNENLTEDSCGQTYREGPGSKDGCSQ